MILRYGRDLSWKFLSKGRVLVQEEQVFISLYTEVACYLARSRKIRCASRKENWWKTISIRCSGNYIFVSSCSNAFLCQRFIEPSSHVTVSHLLPLDAKGMLCARYTWEFKTMFSSCTPFVVSLRKMNMDSTTSSPTFESFLVKPELFTGQVDSYPRLISKMRLNGKTFSTLA